MDRQRLARPTPGSGDLKDSSDFRVLGVRVHAATIDTVLGQMVVWIEGADHRCHTIASVGMHGLMIAHGDEAYRGALNAADLCFPDGIGLLLVGRFHGIKIRKRETGPELLLKFSDLAQVRRYSSYLLGDTPTTLELLRLRLGKMAPRHRIVGMNSPPFRKLSPLEDQAIIDEVNSSGADVLWVALGCPKQERWLQENAAKLTVPVAIGVGAYFKFLAGTVPRAPTWVSNSGFEWAFRLLKEPRRCWHRYLVLGPRFVIFAGLELLVFSRHARSKAS